MRIPDPDRAVAMLAETLRVSKPRMAQAWRALVAAGLAVDDGEGAKVVEVLAVATVAPKPHPIKALLTAWDAVYAEECGDPYLRTCGAKEAALAKTLIASCEHVGMAGEAVIQAMRRFHRDMFWHGKDFTAFASRATEFMRERPGVATRGTVNDPLVMAVQEMRNGKPRNTSPCLPSGERSVPASLQDSSRANG